MPIPKKISNFLKKQGIKYKEIEHKTVYTVFDKSATLKIDPKLIAKSLIIKGDSREFFLTVIPGNKNLDKQKLKKAVNAVRKKDKKKALKKIDFATEQWIKKNLKGVKIGAIPAFGKLFDLPVFVDRSLLKLKKIYVSAGNYENSIIITPAAFKKTVSEMMLGSFSKVRKKK